MIRKLAPVRRLLCAAPSYIARHGAPQEIADPAHHICLPAHNNDNWKLKGPGGTLSYRPEGPLVTNSSEITRAAVIAGAGIALRSTWDIGKELRDGRLVQMGTVAERSSSYSTMISGSNRHKTMKRDQL